jgi:hypothetical protein
MRHRYGHTTCPLCGSSQNKMKPIEDSWSDESSYWSPDHDGVPYVETHVQVSLRRICKDCGHVWFTAPLGADE